MEKCLPSSKTKLLTFENADAFFITNAIKVWSKFNIR